MIRRTFSYATKPYLMGNMNWTDTVGNKENHPLDSMSWNQKIDVVYVID